MNSTSDDDRCLEIINIFNATFKASYNTVLVGGYEEPFYLAPSGSSQAEIRFKANYPRSACHELGHWFVAGKERRLLDDFGYWYAPDGRGAEQQRAFYKVEVIPQAYEWMSCDRLGLDFEVSMDNLNGEECDGRATFAKAVRTKKESLERDHRTWSARFSLWMNALEAAQMEPCKDVNLICAE